MLRWTAVASLLVLVSAACSSEPAQDLSSDARTYEDASALADLLATAGGCQDRQPVDPLGVVQADGVGYELPSALRCETGAAGDAYLFVYRSPSDRVQALDEGHLRWADFCEEFELDVPSAWSVIGQNWRVVVATKSAALDVWVAVAQGDVEKVPCLAAD